MRYQVHLKISAPYFITRVQREIKRLEKVSTKGKYRNERSLDCKKYLDNYFQISIEYCFMIKMSSLFKISLHNS